MENKTIKDVKFTGEIPKNFETILTPEAIEFLEKLHHKFNPQRLNLLKDRAKRQERINGGEKPNFLSETEGVRHDPAWKVAPTPKDLHKRWVEITGPTDRKMVINALNSGANVFMADFEDANSPTWENMVHGQINLKDAVRKRISLETPQGKSYKLNDDVAVLFVRPRGWHLDEKHMTIAGEPISGSLFDFGLYMFHNAKELVSRGTGPYFYLPKLESHLEARLWNDVFVFAQEQLGIERGTVRATVLIETILAVFEMEEILYELREHSAGLNAGRWDYIFSVIKKFRRSSDACLPDRDQVTMTVPFMRAYTELLIKTCHKRGAHAIGGMAAFIPNRKDPVVTEKALKKVKEDKVREAHDGCDGTWVAHPDLVPIVRDIFEKELQGNNNQKSRMRDDVRVQGSELLNFAIHGSTITEAGIRKNINVTLQYLASWLQGTGAAAIDNLMEDTATAEISRAQIWQWLVNKSALNDGRTITNGMIDSFINEELQNIKALYGEHFNESVFQKAQKIFEKLVFSEHFIEFLTLEAYREF